MVRWAKDNLLMGISKIQAIGKTNKAVQGMVANRTKDMGKVV
jgi:hypothetical protein